MNLSKPEPRSLLIRASGETSGHLTTGSAKFCSQQFLELLLSAPQRAM